MGDGGADVGAGGASVGAGGAGVGDGSGYPAAHVAQFGVPVQIVPEQHGVPLPSNWQSWPLATQTVGGGVGCAVGSKVGGAVGGAGVGGVGGLVGGAGVGGA